MIRSALTSFRKLSARFVVPEAVKIHERLDARGLGQDPGIGAAVEAAIEWLLVAQARSGSRDGGVARHFSLVGGWAPSYPETTGYIIPTLLAWGSRTGDERVLTATRAMADWLLQIQLPEGGFQGGVIGSVPVVPVTFNTGQILIGLAAASEAWGEPYLGAMNRAARWLNDTQDADGCWRRYPTPFAAAGEKVYETHVAWGLIEAERVAPSLGYAEAALANLRWAVRSQRENGWVDHCCLTDSSAPLTHTLGYFLRGVLEGYRFFGEASLRSAAERTARGILETIRPDGFLAGRLDARWRPTVKWACLTGSVQIAHCCLILFEETGDERYLSAGIALNRFVRRTILLEGGEGVRGGVKGSFPISGDYGKYEFLNWAAKFFVDSNLLEARVRGTR